MKIVKNSILGFLLILCLPACSVIMPKNPYSPTSESDANTLVNTVKDLHFKPRPNFEPFDSVDHKPNGYVALSMPKIITGSNTNTTNTNLTNKMAKVDSQLLANTVYNTVPYLVKKNKKEINVRLSNPSDWKGNYFRFRKNLPLNKIEMINDKDTCYIVKYTLNEITDVKPYNISIVLDHSGSMGHDRCVELQDAVSRAFQESESKNKVSVIKFDSQISFEGKSSDSAEIQKIIYNKIGMDGFGGSTSIYDALDLAIDSLKADPTYRPLIVLFSDGYENSSRVRDLVGIVNKAKSNNIPVFTIAFGNGADVNLLKGIADETNGVFFMIYDRDEFKSVLNNELFLLNHYYEVKFLPCSFDYDKIRFEGYTESGNKVTGEKTMKGLKETLALNVNFDFDKSIISPKYNDELKKIANYLNANPSYALIVTGHTDNAGTTQYNMDLSVKRAEAIKRALINLGVDQKRIQAIGKGETMPYVPNDTEENRSRNRRIELELIKN
jgi:outer membrane protein OmpA-like peptidoglycan-associated protein/uncharacterized protein YegL